MDSLCLFYSKVYFWVWGSDKAWNARVYWALSHYIHKWKVHCHPSYYLHIFNLDWQTFIAKCFTRTNVHISCCWTCRPKIVWHMIYIILYPSFQSWIRNWTPIIPKNHTFVGRILGWCMHLSGASCLTHHGFFLCEWVQERFLTVPEIQSVLVNIHQEIYFSASQKLYFYREV